ncbi:MAG: CapA family protein [Candidatus Jorgensenbacteria bacterium]|nr:CapA family protein [Candidatus Jorgensenbacteria bacterium]
MRALIVVIIGLALGFFSGAGLFHEIRPQGEVVPLRASALAVEAEPEATLVAVGDIMLSRAVGRRIASSGDFIFPFRNIAPIIQVADVAFGNLESLIAAGGEDQGNYFSFRAAPQAAEGLSFAGFDILSLANNHNMDWGSGALLETINILSGRGIRTVGAGKDSEEANASIIINANGIKIGFLAYTLVYQPNPSAGGLATETCAGTPPACAGIAQAETSKFSLASAEENVRHLRTEADIVAISFHWGNEYETKSSEEQQVIAHAMIDAGGDLIIGHHPHVVQEVEQYKNGWIAYSLGNFVFDQYFSKETMEGLLLKVDIKGNKIAELSQMKIQLNGDFQPEAVGL